MPRGDDPAKTRRPGSSKADTRRQRQLEAARRERRKRRLLVLGGAASVALVVAVVLVVINRSGGNDALTLPTQAAVPTRATTPATAPAAVSTATAGDPTTTAQLAGAPTTTAAPVGTETTTGGNGAGDPNAPVHVIEYGDYQCPFCGQFARTYDEQIMSDYVDTGKVYFEFRDFPFLDKRVNGTESHDAAEAAHCAADQGKFWEYHEALYANQGSRENGGAFARDRLIAIASGLGLDVDAFTTCLDNNTYAAQVQQSAADARAAGVNSTPTFIINGQSVTGANYDKVRAAIDAELAKP